MVRGFLNSVDPVHPVSNLLDQSRVSICFALRI